MWWWNIQPPPRLCCLPFTVAQILKMPRKKEVREKLKVECREFKYFNAHNFVLAQWEMLLIPKVRSLIMKRFIWESLKKIKSGLFWLCIDYNYFLIIIIFESLLKHQPEEILKIELKSEFRVVLLIPQFRFRFQRFSIIQTNFDLWVLLWLFCRICKLFLTSVDFSVFYKNLKWKLWI